MAPKIPKKVVLGEVSNPMPPIANPPISQEGWTMNAVVQLTGSVGRLEGSINSLIDQISQLRTDQASTAERLEKVERKMIVAASIVAIAVGVGGFVANKAIDFGLEMAKVKFTEQQATPAQVAPQALNQAPPKVK